MSRTSRVFASVSLGYLQLVASAAFGLWFTPFLLRHIGRSDFGLWATGMPILAYVGLVDFGVMTIFQRDVAFALGEAQGDLTKLTALPFAVGTTLRLVLLQMPILLVGVTIAWVSLPSGWSAIHVPLALLLGCLVLTFPLRIYHALLTGLQDLRFLGVVTLATWALGSLASAVLVKMGWGLNALAISWVLSQVGMYATCLVRAKSRYPTAIGGGLPKLSFALASEKLGKGFWVIISQLAVMLATGTDVLVIAAVLGPAAVTPYTITDKLVTMLNNVPVLIMTASQPALSELSKGSNRHRLNDVCISLTRVVLLVSGLVGAVVVVADQGFVGWWVGEHEFGGRPLVFLLVADMLVSHWTIATAYGLFSFGYERLISMTSVVTAVVMAGATVLLIRRFGPLGAPLAAVLARGLITLPVLLRATARATGGSVTGMVFSVFAWFWRLGLVVAVGLFATRNWTPRTVLELCLTGAATTALYVLVMAPLALSGPLGAYTRPRLAALKQRLARSA